MKNWTFLRFLALPLTLCSLAAAEPALEYVLPPTNAIVRALDQIEVHFNLPVLGVEAADLLINATPATNVTEVAPGAFVFEFVAPAEGSVEVAWASDHGITDAASLRTSSRAGPGHILSIRKWSAPTCASMN